MNPMEILTTDKVSATFTNLYQARHAFFRASQLEAKAKIDLEEAKAELLLIFESAQISFDSRKAKFIIDGLEGNNVQEREASLTLIMAEYRPGIFSTVEVREAAFRMKLSEYFEAHESATEAAAEARLALDIANLEYSEIKFLLRMAEVATKELAFESELAIAADVLRSQDDGSNRV